jgi:predicted dehydrogenase
MSKPGLALIGSGWAARELHLAGYSELFELQVVCGRRKKKLEALQREFGFRHATTDFQEVVSDDKVNVVSICIPASLRLPIIQAAAKAGKHIFCEKPLAWNLEEARACIEVCEKQGVKLAVADQYRFFPHIQKAAELIGSGSIGRPFLGLVENKLYFDFPAYPGQTKGFVIEQVTHNFDLLRALLGEEFVEVYARMGRSPAREGRDDLREFWAALTLVSESEVTVQLFVSWDCLGFDISRGQIEHYGTRESMKAFLACVADSGIEAGREHPVSGREYLKTLLLAFASYESVQSGRPVRVKT